jgi:hypothetical protein
MLLRRHVNAALGDRLVVWIDPAKVDGYINAKSIAFLPVGLHRIVRRTPFHDTLWMLQPFIYGRRKVEDLLGRGSDYRASAWYALLRADLARHGRAQHKQWRMHSTDEIDAFFRDYVTPLIGSLRNEGYRVDRAPEHGLAIVDGDGRLLKANRGRHRFFIARQVGVVTMPLKVFAVHVAWARRNGVTRSKTGLEQLAEALAEVQRRHAR